MNIFHHSVFPSIITETQCDLYHYIRKDLIDWIYNYQSTTESVHLSNCGGWQSPSNFHILESFSEFKSYIWNNTFETLAHYNRKFELDNMWININGKGHYNISHNHPGCLMSGVFWIKTPKNCGRLVFENPHSFSEGLLIKSADVEMKKKLNYHYSFNFTPKEGVIVMFPAHLNHFVEMNQSDEDRISIAFNLQ